MFSHSREKMLAPLDASSTYNSIFHPLLPHAASDHWYTRILFFRFVFKDKNWWHHFLFIKDVLLVLLKKHLQHKHTGQIIFILKLKLKLWLELKLKLSSKWQIQLKSKLQLQLQLFIKFQIQTKWKKIKNKIKNKIEIKK